MRKQIRSSAWLEHYTDNVGVSSSNLLGSTENPNSSNAHGGLAQLARAPALHAGGQRFESVILHIAPQPLKGGGKVPFRGFRGERSLTYWKK